MEDVDAVKVEKRKQHLDAAPDFYSKVETKGGYREFRFATFGVSVRKERKKEVSWSWSG